MLHLKQNNTHFKSNYIVKIPLSFIFIHQGILYSKTSNYESFFDDMLEHHFTQSLKSYYSFSDVMSMVKIYLVVIQLLVYMLYRIYVFLLYHNTRMLLISWDIQIGFRTTIEISLESNHTWTIVSQIWQLTHALLHGYRCNTYYTNNIARLALKWHFVLSKYD